MTAKTPAAAEAAPAALEPKTGAAMVRDAAVFARGKVAIRTTKPIHLDGCHPRLSQSDQASHARQIAFLD
ncbi:MAG TPA: hypothetical protein VGL53_24030 [Bryobacteraceae bacterium]|jgi:hypothetical protein